MTADPIKSKLIMLDFRPSCIDGDNACHNAATHMGRSRCCSEVVLIACQQCRNERLTDLSPWPCPRCGQQWDKHATAFHWGQL